jgi:hypothetical protein
MEKDKGCALSEAEVNREKGQKRHYHVNRQTTDYDNRHEAKGQPCAFLGDRERIDHPEIAAQSTGPRVIGSFFLHRNARLACR